ncbi:hypothetical protein N7523_008376 [Penicillium sp. IBT 18751x]|nr:hypothetical protein N7523_008376 [Penicillium sp. IBT 18751x]
MMLFKIDVTALLYIVFVLAIVGSYGRTISSFTIMGSSRRNTHIPDHSTHTVSYAILFPTVER